MYNTHNNVFVRTFLGIHLICKLFEHGGIVDLTNLNVMEWDLTSNDALPDITLLEYHLPRDKCLLDTTKIIPLP